MVGSVPQITDKAHLKREGGFVSDLTLHRSVLTCSSTTSGYPGAGRRSKPLREQKKRDTQCASLFLLVAGVGLEPHDLRVMSPTSYQLLYPAILFFRMEYRLSCGTGKSEK